MTRITSFPRSGVGMLLLPLCGVLNVNPESYSRPALLRSLSSSVRRETTIVNRRPRMITFLVHPVVPAPNWKQPANALSFMIMGDCANTDFVRRRGIYVAAQGSALGAAIPRKRVPCKGATILGYRDVAVAREKPNSVSPRQGSGLAAERVPGASPGALLLLPLRDVSRTQRELLLEVRFSEVHPQLGRREIARTTRQTQSGSYARLGASQRSTSLNGIRLRVA